MKQTEKSNQKSRRAYAAPALTKGLAVLEFLGRAGRPCTQAEIGRALERSPNELFRMLAVLADEGYVRRDAQGCFELTLKVFLLGQTVDPVRALVGGAVESMREFSEATGCECHLSVMEVGRLVVLAQESGRGAVTIMVRAGSSHDPRRTASGRLLLALMEPEVARRHYLAAAAAFSDAGPEWTEFEAGLRALRRRGYAVAVNESLTGLEDVAVAVRDGDGRILAALASSRFVSGKRDGMTARIREALEGAATQTVAKLARGQF